MFGLHAGRQVRSGALLHSHCRPPQLPPTHSCASLENRPARPHPAVCSHLVAHCGGRRRQRLARLVRHLLGALLDLVGSMGGVMHINSRLLRKRWHTADTTRRQQHAVLPLGAGACMNNRAPTSPGSSPWQSAHLLCRPRTVHLSQSKSKLLLHLHHLRISGGAHHNLEQYNLSASAEQ